MSDQGSYTAIGLPTDGSTADAADITTDLVGLIDEFNKSIGSSKITDAAITEAKIADEAVSAAKRKPEAWTSFTSTPLVGWSGTPTQTCYYMKDGKTVHLRMYITGTSNSTTTTVTLPFAVLRNGPYFPMKATDNGAFTTTLSYIDVSASSATATCYASNTGAAWTSSGVKTVNIQMTYEAV